MNWEHSVLNRIYKTLDFKISITNINTNKNKFEYIEKLNILIDKFNLNELLNVSLGGALYKKKEDKRTFYFDYVTNYYFLLFTNFFEIEKKFINYEDYNFEGVLKDETREEIRLLDGLTYSNQMKTYLLKLLLLKESDRTKFNTELSRINDYLQYRTVLIGHSVSHYDIILLSIIQNWKKKKERVIYFTSNNLINIIRWCGFLDIYLDLDYLKIEKSKELKLKENLGDTYKLISNQDLVSSVAVLSENSLSTVINLLEAGENVNSRELHNYKTLSHLVCRKGNFEMLRVLINYGCDLEALDDEEMTPIFEAIYSKNIDLCEYLIEVERVNLHHLEIQNRSPFYWAACAGDLTMIDYLLSKPGMDVNNTSKMGRTPLSKTCWNGNIEIVKRLCEQKAIRINLPDKNGRYPLHNAVWGEYGGRLGKKVNGLSSNDCPEAALYLINKGHLLEVEDCEGYTPLMISASTNGIKSLELLIDRGANPNYLNKFKATALIEATRYGNAEPVKILLEKAKNVDIDVRDIHGLNAIEYAVCFKREESLQFLITYKDKNKILREEELLDLVLLAIQSDSKQCFKILLDKINEKEISDFNFNYNFNNGNSIDGSNNNIYENDIGYQGKEGNYSKYVSFFKEIIQRTLNLFNYELFNTIVKDYFHYVELLFFTDIEFLFKSLILKRKLELENANKEANNLCNDIINSDLTKTNSPNTPKTKINKFEDEGVDQESSIDENQNQEVKNIFMSNVEKLYKVYIEKIKDGKQISHCLLKLFIYLNDETKFCEIFNLITKDKNEIENIIIDEIKLDIEKYNYILVDKKQKQNKNLYEKEWELILNEISFHNLLTLTIAKPGHFYFLKIINLHFSQKLFFLNLHDNQNILHVLFKEENMLKFKKIINIIEHNYPNKIIKLIEMLDKEEMNGLTPLDVIMKNKLFDMVETYTKELNNLREKHKIASNSHYTHAFYKIIDYSIIVEDNNLLPKEYKSYVDNNLREFSILLKKYFQINNKTNINTNSFEKLSHPLESHNSYGQYGVINELTYTINTNNKNIFFIKEIIEKIKEKNIIQNFKLYNKNYKYHWIDTEESIEYCAKHLMKNNFIGVDLEYHGNNSDIDGIVCVLQISSMEETFAIDTIKLRKEISIYLKHIFEDEKIVKIFHGCDNDLVWLITNFQIFTRNIFDTGRAYLVFQKYILNKSFKVNSLPSLNFLSKFFLQMEIDKSYQKSDWRIRPLTSNMLQYALNDAKSVIYIFLVLIGLYQYLNEEEEFSDEIKEFYKILKDKFSDYTGSDSTKKVVQDSIEMNLILIETCLRCNELIKMKLKDNYLKLNIILNKN